MALLRCSTHWFGLSPAWLVVVLVIAVVLRSPLWWCSGSSSCWVAPHLVVVLGRTLPPPGVGLGRAFALPLLHSIRHRWAFGLYLLCLCGPPCCRLNLLVVVLTALPSS